MSGASVALAALLAIQVTAGHVETAAHADDAGRPSYDIVYVRAPRLGDDTIVPLPEVSTPVRMPPGSDLMLLHPDGTEEVLVEGGNGAIVDPVVSFDAKWIYFARFHDQRPTAWNSQRDASRAGADVFKINLATREVVRLTFQQWTPNTGAAEWASNDLQPKASGPYQLGYGVFNLGPCPLPGGRIMFTSSRNGFLPNKGYTFPNFQLFVMDDDGSNVEEVGFMNLGSALHPVELSDGRVMFASYESQGMRDLRVWALWSIWPDGRNWGPLMSAFTPEQAFHGHAELSNHHIAVVNYYNMNNNGFGTLLAFPPAAPAGTPQFGRARPDDPSNPRVRDGLRAGRTPTGEPATSVTRYPFSPFGLYALTGFTYGRDLAAPRMQDGRYVGKVMHPAGAPGNDVLMVWSPGPANHLDRPTHLPAYDAGLYLLKGGVPALTPDALIKIKNDPAYNELWPKAVVPYRTIYGVDEPADLTRAESPASPLLPKGTPFGLVGTSTFYRRDTAPGVGSATFAGLDPFNTSENGASSNWTSQGADAGRYSSADIYAVRILAMEPTSHRSYGPAEGAGFISAANERLRILGEIPLRKTDAAGKTVIDINGDPDTSFLARIPADTPFTFQTLDRNGMVLNMSQTWHQLRPGEVRQDCGGCHAHSQLPTPFEKTAASRADYAVPDLTRSTPLLTRTAAGATEVVERNGALDVEYYRDIKPVLRRSCAPCHAKTGRREAGLVLDDDTVVNGYEVTYSRLARDPQARFGVRSLLSGGVWREPQMSRYVRVFQSRRSLLIWKVFGRRLDGWTNEDFPTESIPGDASTLPPGARRDDADVDFSGVMCPPPDAPVPALSEDEKLTFARWIDLGAPISSPDAAFKSRGWFQDDLRPTLTIASPSRTTSSQPLAEIRIGAFDYYSGLAPNALSVTASFPVNGKARGTELGGLFKETADRIWTLAVNPPITALTRGVLTVTVRDRAGNLTRLERTFSIGATAR